MNLMEALLDANRKSRKHIEECHEVDKLMPGGAGLDISIILTESLIKEREVAIASDDVAQMVRVAQAHRLGDEEK